ncbi:PheS-related mystery ligase SrmL [Pseudomonas xanthosomatis]|uniref:PheS-related mystery ligase SrmL n=1 Tax=Pseudomonas xanthosomatis TaxID=2842356 RepID=UPI0035174702
MNSKALIPQIKVQSALDIADLTANTHPPHAIRLLLDQVLDGISKLGWPEASMVTGPRIVSAEENYGLLGYANDEVTLGSAHTRWVSEKTLLRTQTTSCIPAALQQAACQRRTGERLLIASPGITFRRDTRDRWHCAEPHQMDVWVLCDPEEANSVLLLELVRDVLACAIPNMAWVHRDSPHHYTEAGIEVNALAPEQAVEVLECGMIAKSLLQRLAIDPHRHGGLALGMGLDRLVMLRKGIPDIRLLRDPLPRVQAQMYDLLPWKPVSRLPSTRRDMSLALSPGLSEEAITERVLAAAGTRANWIEEVTIKGRWSEAELPTVARERLGLLAGQENVLLGIVLRDSSRSLSAQEGNSLYDDLQAALHEGTPGGGYRLNP